MSESIGAQFAKRLLTGVVESAVRAGAKAVESLAGDARKVLQNEAIKAGMLEQGVAAWSKITLGEIIDPNAGAQKKEEKGT